MTIKGFLYALEGALPTLLLTSAYWLCDYLGLGKAFIVGVGSSSLIFFIYKIIDISIDVQSIRRNVTDLKYTFLKEWEKR